MKSPDSEIFKWKYYRNSIETGNSIITVLLGNHQIPVNLQNITILFTYYGEGIFFAEFNFSQLYDNRLVTNTMIKQ